MALVLSNPISNVFTPGIPGFAGGVQQLPVGNATNANKSGTVPQSFLFDEFQSLEDQGLKSNVAFDSALPFNSFNNDIFSRQLDSGAKFDTPQMLSGSGPLRIFEESTLIPPIQQTASRQSLATGGFVSNQDVIAQQNQQTVQNQLAIARSRGFNVIDPTINPRENDPVNATTLAQFGNAVVNQAGNTAKGITAGASDSLAFIVNEIFSKNVLLVAIVAGGIYLVTRGK